LLLQARGKTARNLLQHKPPEQEFCHLVSIDVKYSRPCKKSKDKENVEIMVPKHHIVAVPGAKAAS
jgi:hypothetical protein